MATIREDLWTYREQTPARLIGYGVEASDGSIGTIDDAGYDVGAGYIVVDTGPWIFGKKVMLPAGVITTVNADDETVTVNRTKTKIKNAPAFAEGQYSDEEYRNDLGAYYGHRGAGAGTTADTRRALIHRGADAAPVLSRFEPKGQAPPRRCRPSSADVSGARLRRAQYSATSMNVGRIAIVFRHDGQLTTRNW